MPNFSIAVVSRQRDLRFDRRRLIRLARSVLRQEQVAAAEISVAILDDRKIHAINRQFLNHDYPTDVISFVLECRVDKEVSGNTPNNVRRGTAKVIDGEIVISAQTAVRNAASYGIGPQNELALYLVHGLLHICGYDDRTPAEKRLMRRREAEALLAFDIVVPSRAAKRGRSPK
jgi:probable rRNA maturation factor